MNIKVLNFFFNTINKMILGVLVCIFIFFISCNIENTTYKSNFTNQEYSHYSQSEFWFKNRKDWQIANNRIECLVSKKDRKIKLLTRKLKTENGNLEMKVRLGFFNHKISNFNKNWAGFHIGNQKNNDLKISKGIHIGICTNGALFIGDPSLNHKNETIINALKTGVDLRVLITNYGKNYTIDFSVLEIGTQKILSRISKKGIAPEQISGDLSLISNFDFFDKNAPQNTKSVWFQNWEIKGSKVILIHKNTGI